MVEFPFLGFLFDLLHCLFIDYGEEWWDTRNRKPD